MCVMTGIIKIETDNWR